MNQKEQGQKQEEDGEGKNSPHFGKEKILINSKEASYNVGDGTPRKRRKISEGTGVDIEADYDLGVLLSLKQALKDKEKEVGLLRQQLLRADLQIDRFNRRAQEDAKKLEEEAKKLEQMQKRNEGILQLNKQGVLAIRGLQRDLKDQVENLKEVKNFLNKHLQKEACQICQSRDARVLSVPCGCNVRCSQCTIDDYRKRPKEMEKKCLRCQEEVTGYREIEKV